MEEDWEEIRSSISDDVEWIDGELTPERCASPLVPASLVDELTCRLRVAEIRAAVAEERVERLTGQLAASRVEVVELQLMVEAQQLENIHLGAIIEQDRVVGKPSSTRKKHELSKAMRNKIPQAVKLSKREFWTKTNHRSNAVASRRNY